jgi:hypothetical protein
MEELVRQSGAEWRQRLAGGLNAVVRMLGEQYREDGGSDSSSH